MFKPDELIYEEVSSSDASLYYSAMIVHARIVILAS